MFLELKKLYALLLVFIICSINLSIAKKLITIIKFVITQALRQSLKVTQSYSKLLKVTQSYSKLLLVAQSYSRNGYHCCYDDHGAYRQYARRT